MALPLLPIALVAAAAAALGYVLYEKKLGGSDELPADLQAPFEMLRTKGEDAASIELVAKKLDAYGYTKQAAALRARIAALKPQTQVSAIPPTAAATQAAAAAAPPPAAAPQAQAAAPPAAGPLPPMTIDLPGGFARVTTHDPAPSGDLNVFSDPSGTKKIGGAEKNSVVTILDAQGAYKMVKTQNVARRYPDVTGWVHGSFLTPVQGSASVSGRRASALVLGGLVGCGAKVLCPEGLRLRTHPTYAAGASSAAGYGETVSVERTLPDRKIDPRSPGPGGWARVTSRTGTGWVPAEWLGGN